MKMTMRKNEMAKVSVLVSTKNDEQGREYIDVYKRRLDERAVDYIVGATEKKITLNYEYGVRI